MTSSNYTYVTSISLKFGESNINPSSTKACVSVRLAFILLSPLFLKRIPIMIHRTKGTNSYLTRIAKKIPQISNLPFIFPGFLCDLELAKGNWIIELKRLVFAGFLCKENEIIFLWKNLFQEILNLCLLYRTFWFVEKVKFSSGFKTYKWEL